MTIELTARRFLVSALAVATVAATPLLAQRANVGKTDTERSPIVQKMEKEVGQMAIDYWTPKLNEYKTSIDRVLSVEDLASLNRLRVRWGMLVDEGMREHRARREASGVNGNSVEMKIDPNAMNRLQEVMEIFSAAKEMTTRYRSELDRIGTGVIGDATDFVGSIAERADRFAEENSAEIEKDKSAREMLSGRQKLTTVVADLRSEKGQKGLQSIYSFVIEPVVLLYDGVDLAALVGQLPMASSVTGEISLPESSTLKQNFPNPASSVTTISYTLSEPSSATLVRIYDARGEVVGTFDEGPRAAGDHQLTLDVSEFATGSYLYHLTIRTPKGQRVHSKGMQVVR